MGRTMNMVKTLADIAVVGTGGMITGAGIGAIGLARAVEYGDSQVGFWRWLGGSFCPNGLLSMESQLGLLADEIPKEIVAETYSNGAGIAAVGAITVAIGSYRLLKRMYTTSK